MRDPAGTPCARSQNRWNPCASDQNPPTVDQLGNRRGISLDNRAAQQVG